MTLSEMMFFPPLFGKDEFLTGYRGRLAVLNNCRSVAELDAAIRRHSASGGASKDSRVLSRADGERVNFVGSVAGALECPEDSLLLSHTLWGMSIAIRDSGQGSGDGASTVSMRKAPLMRLRNALVWLCPSCVEADVGSTHWSFWHRGHQVPGRFRCSHHGDVLRAIDCPALLTQAPHEAMGRAQLPDEQAIMYGDISTSAAITADLLEAFLSGMRVRPRREARLALCERAKAFFGLGSGGAVTAELSKLFTEVVPRAWISDLLPRAKFSQGSQAFVQNIIEQDVQRSSSCAYALVAGQVCESFEDAAAVLGLKT